MRKQREIEAKDSTPNTPNVPGTKDYAGAAEKATPIAPEEVGEAELDDPPHVAGDAASPVVPGTPGFEAAPFVQPVVPGTPNFEGSAAAGYAPGPEVPAVPDIPISVSSPAAAEAGRREEQAKHVSESKSDEVARRTAEKKAAQTGTTLPPVPVPVDIDAAVKKMAQAAQEAAKVS